MLIIALNTGWAVAAELPKGFVRLREIDASIVQDMRYAGRGNFTGSKVPGYEAGECILARPVAQSLAQVQKALSADGHGLMVFDCYRPVRAVQAFVRWASGQGNGKDPVYHPNVAGNRLVSEGYIGARSGHSSGGSIDLTLGMVQQDGRFEPVEMGGRFDLFDPLSHVSAKSVSPEARANRKRLQQVMNRHGFSGYSREWWHFRFADEPFAGQRFDFPVTAAD
ncbi:MAG: M15 family metallopeptidase [Rhizobiaceae bacterium]